MSGEDIEDLLIELGHGTLAVAAGGEAYGVPLSKTVFS